MNILASRLPALKFLAMAAAIQYGLTLVSNVRSIPFSPPVPPWWASPNTWKATFNLTPPS
jgi:hypothetical protein